MISGNLQAITVGVPVTNESTNIIYLLRSILKQKQTFYTLKEIIVNCEGCSENLIEKIKSYSIKNPVVRVLTDSRIKGRKERIQEIFLQASGTFTFIFDDTVILNKTDVLDKMANRLMRHKVMFVYANLEPLPVKGLKANMIRKWYQIWFNITKKFNNGDNIDTVQNLACGVKTEFAKNIIFPKEPTSESQYMYLAAKSRQYVTRFISDVSVFMFTPPNFSEYQKLKEIWDNRSMFAGIFGKKLYAATSVPIAFKIRSMIFSILKNPFNIVLIFLFSLPSPGKYLNDTSFMSLRTIKRKAHSY